MWKRTSCRSISKARCRSSQDREKSVHAVFILRLSEPTAEANEYLNVSDYENYVFSEFTTAGGPAQRGALKRCSSFSRSW